ncbi:hypothetical protein [Photobacterium phosphoreum]|nr:hypothetical protein [Photobacterium phosphoreum]
MIYQPPPCRRNYQPDTSTSFHCVGMVKETNARAQVAVRKGKYKK